VSRPTNRAYRERIRNPGDTLVNRAEESVSCVAQIAAAEFSFCELAPIRTDSASPLIPIGAWMAATATADP
jgi:hypothetical protein